MSKFQYAVTRVCSILFLMVGVSVLIPGLTDGKGYETAIENVSYPETEVQELLAPDPSVTAQFGTSVAIDGDTLVAGAPGARNANGNPVGSAYVYVQIEGEWVFQARLWPDEDQLNSQFGSAVAISDNTIVIGSWSHDVGSDLSRGAAYVFVRTSSSWLLQQKLFAIDEAAGGRFGQSVAIDGDRVVVGAMEAPVRGIRRGSAYVYLRTGEWIAEAQLEDVDGTFGDRFGFSSDIDGDTIVVGATATGLGKEFGFGGVCVFRRINEVWTRETRILPSNGQQDGRFGSSVSLQGDRVAIGAYNEFVTGSTHRGAAYLYERNGGLWSQSRKFVLADQDTGNMFGSTIGLDGNRIIIGEHNSRVNGRDRQGAAYVYKLEMGEWMFQSKLVASNGLAADLFATGVAIDQNKFLVGAPGVDRNGIGAQGGAYLFYEAPIRPDLESSSDSGISDTDNITNASSVSFRVRGITPGATVQLLRTGVVVDSSVVEGQETSLQDFAPPEGTFFYSIRQIVNGQTSSASETLPVTIDRTRPQIMVEQFSTQADPTREVYVRYVALFAEPVFGFGPSDISLVGSTANVTNVEVSVYQDVVPNQIYITGIVSNGDYVRASIPANVLTDAAGNLNMASVSSDNTIVVDNVAPTVTVEQHVEQPDPTDKLPIRYSVVFSEPVTGFSRSSLSFFGSTVDRSNLSSEITGSGSTYEVAIGGLGQMDGILRLSVQSGGGRDLIGNNSSPSTSIDNSVLFSNRVRDGGFEATNSSGQNPNWSTTSTRFGTSLCTSASCGNGGGTAVPRNGNAWAWFDGSDNTNAETGTVSQVVTFPLNVKVALSYYLRVGFVSSPSSSVFRVKVDGTTVQTINEPASAESAYTPRLIDLSSFADGQPHLVTFEYHRPAGSAADNFSLDDVTLIVDDAAEKRIAPFDFDGDGKADISIFRSSVGQWWYVRSSDSDVRAVAFGNATDKPVPADYTGDGKTDVAFWRPSTGEWFTIRSEDNTFYSFPFGAEGDVPMPGDFDGDGKADASVFRPGTGTWFIQRSGDGNATIAQFGIAGDQAIAADYDGDGKADIAIFRPSDGSWWYSRSSDGSVRAFAFGTSTDRPVPADYTGDGKADVAVWRPSTGEWFVQRSEDNSYYSFPFGLSTDFPVPGDYDGDGKTDAAVFRPSNSTWYISGSTSGFFAVGFGATGDQPLPNAYVR